VVETLSPLSLKFGVIKNAAFVELLIFVGCKNKNMADTQNLYLSFGFDGGN
jgi:hypothetical protein